MGHVAIQSTYETRSNAHPHGGTRVDDGGCGLVIQVRGSASIHRIDSYMCFLLVLSNYLGYRGVQCEV